MIDESAKPVPPERKPVEMICQICGDPLRLRRVVQCGRCQTLHHLECWRFNKGCAMYGCGSRAWEEAPPTESPIVRTDFERTPGQLAERHLAQTSPLFALVCFVGAGNLAATTSVLAALVPGAAGIGLLWLYLRYGKWREYLHLDSENRAIDWRLEGFGRSLKEKKGWLTAGEVVELHLHTISSVPGATLCALYALLVDGQRRLLHKVSGAAGTRVRGEMDLLADQLAAFADCTVRRIEGWEAPPPAEIAEALAQKRFASSSSPPAPSVPAPALPEPSPPVSAGNGSAAAEEPRPERRPERTV